MQKMSTGTFVGIMLLLMAISLFVLVHLPILANILIGFLVFMGIIFLLLGVLRA